MVYPYNRIPFSNREEPSADTSCKVDGPRKHDTECNEPDTQDHIVHSIHRICPEFISIGRLIETENR